MGSKGLVCCYSVRVHRGRHLLSSACCVYPPPVTTTTCRRRWTVSRSASCSTTSWASVCSGHPPSSRVSSAASSGQVSCSPVNIWYDLKQIATESFSVGMHSEEASLKHTKNPLRHLWGKQVKSAIKVTFSH